MEADVSVDRPPILIQHGNGWDAASWLSALAVPSIPFPLWLASKGHPIWMMNSRGTEYSRRHTRLDPNSPEYWSFNMQDMYLDIEENINVIKAYLGYDELWYVGYSGATSQMLFGLATQEEFLKTRLLKAILMAPCTIPQFKQPGALEMYTAGIDIFEISGPNWQSDRTKACTVVNSDTCSAMAVFDKAEATSLNMNVQFSQIQEVKRF